MHKHFKKLYISFACVLWYIVFGYTISFATNNLRSSAIINNTYYGDEKVYFSNGDVMDMTGTTYHADGTVTLPDGAIKDIYGIIHYSDGSIKLPDGTIFYINGQVGFAKDANNNVLENTESNEEQNITPGSWEYNPKKNSWQYVDKENDVVKKIYKDQWIATHSAEGKVKWYAVDTEGDLIIGWLKDKGKFYYLLQKPSQRGELAFGETVIDGKKYVFDDETGELIEGEEPTRQFEVLEADNHKSGRDGVWRRNALGQKYFTHYKRGLDGKIEAALPEGWFMIDGHYYYFTENGVPSTGLIIYDNKYYYMKEDGTMLEGGDIIIDGLKYEFDKYTGACKSINMA